MAQMNWKLLYFGKIKREEINKYVNDDEWQLIRLSMKGKSLKEKYDILSLYKENNLSIQKRAVEVRITNYVTALSRGGLIIPSDYR